MALLSDAAITALRYLRAAADDPARWALVDVDEAASVLPSAVLVELARQRLIETQVMGRPAGRRVAWRAASAPKIRTYAAITDRGRERLRRIEGASVRREMTWE